MKVETAAAYGDIFDHSAGSKLAPSGGLPARVRGDEERAVQDYTKAIHLNPRDALAFYRRAIAYDRKGDDDRAIQEYNEAIQLSPKLQSAFRNRGAARFHSGQFTAAVPDFMQAAKMNPKDAYSPLWLYLARSRVGQEARGELARDAAGLDLTRWPGQVVGLYLGKATPEAIYAAAKNADPKKDQEQLCEAYYFLGQQAMQVGNRQEASRLFQQAIDTGVTVCVEYTGAQAELKRSALAQPNAGK